MRPDLSDQPRFIQANQSSWRQDHKDWERDVSRWQADHQRALADLHQMERLIIAHGEALRRHAGNLDAHGKAAGQFEASRGDAQVPGPTINRLAREHLKWREVHDRIRRHHESVMVQLRTLQNALTAPM